MTRNRDEDKEDRDGRLGKEKGQWRWRMKAPGDGDGGQGTGTSGRRTGDKARLQTAALPLVSAARTGAKISPAMSGTRLRQRGPRRLLSG